MYESDDIKVSHPAHYISNDLEVIDVIKAFTEGLNGIEATDTGNIIKYACRWKNKNGIQDLKKIMWYTNHLIEHMEGKMKKIDQVSVQINDVVLNATEEGIKVYSKNGLYIYTVASILIDKATLKYRNEFTFSKGEMELRNCILTCRSDYDPNHKEHNTYFIVEENKDGE